MCVCVCDGEDEGEEDRIGGEGDEMKERKKDKYNKVWVIVQNGIGHVSDTDSLPLSLPGSPFSPSSFPPPILSLPLPFPVGPYILYCQT